VKSHRSTSWSCMEHTGQRLRVDDLGYGTLTFILHGRLLLYLMLSFLYFYLGKENVDLAFKPRN
jgi:hypothetical protein